MLHGWPGSIVEFQAVLPRLAEDFDVVAPSLPGYGFSEPTRTPGWDPHRIARAFIELMARLGYDRYGVQGGDWGSQVATQIGALDPEHCVALHLNMAVARRPKEDVELSPEDQADLGQMAAFGKEESAYSQLQGTRPQTLGAGLNDSPAGLLSWIVEKFRAWSDCDGDPENAFTRDQLLTNVMVYWVTGTITSSTRLYWELQHTERATAGLRHRPHRCRPLPEGAHPLPPALGRAGLQRDPLGGDAPGRPLRRHGAARPVRRRRP